MRRSLAFLVILCLVANVSGASLRDIELSDTTVDVGDDFYVEVTVGGGEAGMYVEFFVDGYRFSRKNVRTDEETVTSSRYDEFKWDMNELKCGEHKITAYLIRSNTTLDSISETLGVGNLPVIKVSPERPLVGRSNNITFKDKDSGNGLSGMSIGILNVKTSEIVKQETGSGGVLEYRFPDYGKYRLIINDNKYCGEIEVNAKKNIVIDGPRPSNPVVGELITVALPSGVGLKVIYVENGSTYKAAYTTIGGGANFTIERAGSYILRMGELSSLYWERNETLNVSEKGVPDVTTSPEKGVIGEFVSLSIKSGGAPLADAIVTVTEPDNSFETYTTASSGEIVYTPASIGEYSVKVEKNKYQTVSRTFSVRNDLRVVMVPEDIRVGDNVTLTVKNQMGNAVSEASVAVGDLTSGMTDSQGMYSFVLSEAKSYDLKITKTRYWDYSKTLTALGIMSFNLSTSAVEVGNNVTLAVFDNAGSRITADVLMVGGGISEPITSETFVPNIPGTYNISVTKSGYKSVSGMLTVLPHPLDVNFDVQGSIITMTLSSHGSPVPGITAGVNGNESVSDENGQTVVEITDVGQYIFSINEANANRDYESKNLAREVVKDYHLLLLIAPVLLVVILAAAAIIFIHEGHKKLYLLHDGIHHVRMRLGKGDSGGQLKKGKKSSLSKV